MNTKLLMTISAVFTGVIGFSLTFLPQEIIGSLQITKTPITQLAFQFLGALYLGFTLLNWMAKGSIIGGIYNKPIIIGNLLHFGMTGIALIKAISSISIHKNVFIILTVLYLLFTVSFGYLFLNNPSKVKS